MSFRAFIFGRKYKNLGRMGHIAQVFMGQGFGHLVTQMGLQRLVPFRRRRMPREEYVAVHAEDTAPVRLRRAFEELGPTFIKLGQVLSGRPDLVTIQFADEFKKLRDEVPPFGYEDAKRIVEKELGARLDVLFSEFEPAPVAAASIAQVHNAVLTSGEKVVVKVRRPGIEKSLEQDISILKGLAHLLEKHVPESNIFNPVAIVEEFARTVRKELDFVVEADNAVRFAENFKGSPSMYIPFIYREYTRQKVLTMERLSGIRISDVAALDTGGYDRSSLARNGAEAFFKQVLEDGFFHADPHAGNMFVLPDGRIGLVDFGIVGRLSEEDMEVIADTFLALVNKDFDGLVQNYITMGFVTEDIDLDRFRHDFKQDLVDLLEPLYGKTLGQISLSLYIDRVTRLALKHHLKFPPGLITMNKALLTIEALGSELDPGFDFIGVAKPYTYKLIKKKYSPGRYSRRLRRKAMDISDFLGNLPRQFRTIMRKVIKDDLHMNMEIAGFDRFIREFDRSTNRMSFSMIIAAIIIGSSVIIHSGKGRLVLGYPFLGLTGYLLAGVLGLWLVWGIVRSGRL
jgi:ubiquinone biosynthesis protein